ncbi:MAG TPA: M23 family metallopeptidase [Anaeromyxobacteraceae bacterium]|nr:M23 family metallopeptidase [Anaeromyxobacteraceae bacterium]
MRPPRSLTTLALLALGLGTGCAALPEPKMSFREAGLAHDPSAEAPVAPVAEPELPVVPPVAVAAPEAVASEQPEGPPLDPALVRFAAEARTRRLRGRGGQGFPPEAEAAWRALVAELDGYLARPLPQTPLLELVRAQVTVEAEWDYDLRRYGAAPPDLARLVLPRAQRFGVRIQASRALGLTMFTKRPPGRLRWPIENAGLSSPFGMRTHPLDGHRQMHASIDLAAERGRVVAAAGKGYVVRAGWVGGYGLLVEVRHAGDLTTRYGHLSALLCAPGDALDAGQAVGLVGQTGLATGPHLHFEVWQGGSPRDPLGLLGGGTQLAGAP